MQGNQQAFPFNWTLVCDSREQIQLDLSVNGAAVERGVLPVGDYGLKDPQGRLFPLVVERKSKGDLFGTLAKGFERFKKEIGKAREAKVQLIVVIEATRSEVAEGFHYSARKGISVVRQLNTLFVKYDIPYIYAQNSFEAARVIEDILGAVIRNYGKVSKDPLHQQLDS